MYAVQEDIPQAWAGSPMNGVDLEAEAGIQVGANKWHSRMTIELWSMVYIIGAVVLLWVLGGIVFRRINID